MTLIAAYIDKESKIGYMTGDRRVSIHSFRFNQKKSKIFEASINDEKCLMGGSGTAPSVNKIENFINSNSSISLMEISNKLSKIGKSNPCYLLILTLDGNIHILDSWGSIINTAEPYYAIGIGDTVAETLLHYTHYMITGQHDIPKLFYKIYEIAEYMLDGVSAKHDLKTLKLDI